MTKMSGVFGGRSKRPTDYYHRFGQTPKKGVFFAHFGTTFLTPLSRVGQKGHLGQFSFPGVGVLAPFGPYGQKGQNGSKRGPKKGHFGGQKRSFWTPFGTTFLTPLSRVGQKGHLGQFSFPGVGVLAPFGPYGQKGQNGSKRGPKKGHFGRKTPRFWGFGQIGGNNR
mgnify:CR=1 FL=1